jgi:GABA permease
MSRLLVVANRTVDSEELLSALEERAAQGPIAVTLLVPACWEVGDPHGGRQSALRRLRAARTRLNAAGVSVEERIGDADPVAAVQMAWDPERFDEVVVATLPARVSRWLGMDLPRRVERLTGREVRHVVAHARETIPA